MTDEAISHRVWLTIRKPPCGYPEAKQSVHLTDGYGRGEGWDDQGWWVEIGDLSVRSKLRPKVQLRVETDRDGEMLSMVQTHANLSLSVEMPRTSTGT